MKKMMNKVIICSAAAAGLFLAAQAADASMTGQCVTCHTMHNSQNASAMTSGTDTAQSFLLRANNTCVGCHSGTKDKILSAYDAPIVIHTDEPTYTVVNQTGVGYPDVLAGGSFYWVENSGATNADNRGHNVAELSNSSDAFLSNTPPGYDGSNYDGTLGCSDCHISGSHHYNNTAGTYVSGTGGTAGGNSYRFLSGRIAGFEDADWEWSVSSSDHNRYAASTTPTSAATNTINAFCASCHGVFHGAFDSGTGNGAQDTSVTSASAGSRWKRHPVDFQLSSAQFGTAGSEYDAYNTYNPGSPVGTDDAATAFSTLAASDDIVLCMSCHRAHGSPYPDMLRWSYQTGAGVSGKNGCFVCHTSK